MTRPPAKTGNPVIKVYKIQHPHEKELAQKIRYDVFVIGQHVPEEEEIDQFEEESYHFLALADEIPCGTARWRFTENGIKLERFAVLEKYRGLGIGSSLVSVVLKDIANHPDSRGKMLYLHAQLEAMRLYSKHGFKKVGELFQECDIDHYKMIKEVTAT